MKRLFTAVLIVTVCFAVAGFGQAKKWQFVKVFPDTSFTANTGVHGIATDPDGKIWIIPYGTTDSIFNGTTYTKTRQVFVFNPNGTPASFSGMKTITISGKTDTLVNSSRGLRADANGNIVYCAFNTYYRINYKTGAGMAKVDPYPEVTAGVTGITPAFTSANEMFVGAVIPVQPMKIFDNSFASLGTAVVAPPGFSRCMEVSKDGNDIYWCGYTTKKVYIYHSDIGTLGTYALKDSMARGMQVETAGWHKQQGYLYLSSGTIDTTDYGNPPVDPPWKPMTWYGFDVTTKTQKDSILWNGAAYPYVVGPGGTLYPRPRGIAFSVSGDTAYVATYNHAKAAVQMFRRIVSAVEPVGEAVPNTYTLSQNFPNPFNPSTQIEFSIPKEGFTTVKVYDMLGKEVATLVNEQLNPGTYRTTLDGSKLSSGTYVYMLTSGTTRITKKMMLVK